MPYMTPTYPENIRLLGPSSWEEIGYQQKNRLPPGIRHPPHLPPHNTCNLILSIFYTKPSAFGLGLEKECKNWGDFLITNVTCIALHFNILFFTPP